TCIAAKVRRRESASSPAEEPPSVPAPTGQALGARDLPEGRAGTWAGRRRGPPRPVRDRRPPDGQGGAAEQAGGRNRPDGPGAGPGGQAVGQRGLVRGRGGRESLH